MSHNIIWKKPDGGVAVTRLTQECLRLHEYVRANADTEDPEVKAHVAFIIENYGFDEHSLELILRARGKVPSDWKCVGHNVECDLRDPKRNKWTWDGEKIVVKE